MCFFFLHFRQSMAMCDFNIGGFFLTLPTADDYEQCFVRCDLSVLFYLTLLTADDYEQCFVLCDLWVLLFFNIADSR